MLEFLSLRNFRNYRDLEVSFSSPKTVLVGENGQGKTNLLESVFFIGMLRSFRTSRTEELKRIGSEGFSIKAEIGGIATWKKVLEIEYSKKRKLKLDGSIVQYASDFIRQIRPVVFSPDDINIIRGSSSSRRRFFDMLISVMEPEYLSALHDYNVSIRSRNFILKNRKNDIDLLKTYERTAAEKGSVIVEFRKRYISVFEDEMKNILKEHFSRSDTFTITYKVQNSTDDVKKYIERFEKERAMDTIKGYTSFGPQTDDFYFYFDSRYMRNYASTGQCRLIALCLKMAELTIFSDSGKNNSRITVLVDDVTGELDSKTKNAFLKLIEHAGQFLFTFTEVPKENFFKDSEFIRVKNAEIEKL